jgi:molybdopterin synthase catalytic subunit
MNYLSAIHLSAIHLTAIHDGPLPVHLHAPTALLAVDHGACASFLGVVRNRSRGGVVDGPYRAVTALHYQCYRPMAERMLTELLAEAAARFDPELRGQIVHGIGDHLPGDVSLAIHIATAHRDAAFAACRHLIERLKQDLPVWKRERYADGSEQWLKGS